MINFRSPQVKGWLVRSPLWRIDRREFTVDLKRWQPFSEPCEAVLKHLTELLADWGAFLEAELYTEVLVHAVGGEPRCVQRLPVARDGLHLGTHRIPCHDQSAGFLVTAFVRDTSANELHLHRLLSCLPLRGLQWFNLNHAELQAITLLKGERKHRSVAVRANGVEARG